MRWRNRNNVMKKLLLAVLSCLLLASCVSCGQGEAEDTENMEEIVGNDWHTWRGWEYTTVEDYGQEVDLAYVLEATMLLAVYDNHSADSPADYAQINLPGELPDLGYSRENLKFIDIDSDGRSDIMIPRVDENELVYNYVYIWDGEDYALNEDMSSIPNLSIEDGKIVSRIDGEVYNFVWADGQLSEVLSDAGTGDSEAKG